MKKKRALLVIGVCVISLLCVAFMNTRYDNLSRYPYQDQEARALIREHLDKTEIEYIIEYAIAPSVFIQYIDKPGFNIYHAEQYNQLAKSLWQESPENIVTMVEEMQDLVDVDTLARLLVHYSYDELKWWYTQGDSYQTDSNLVSNAGDLLAYVDQTQSVGIRVPFNLVTVAPTVPTVDDRTLQIDIAAEEPLEEMCQAIEADLQNGLACGGLKVSQAYVSYADQTTLYEQAKKTMTPGQVLPPAPGHCDNQLGFSVDFVLTDETLPFESSPQGEWLLANAYHFGFIFPYTEAAQEETQQPSSLSHLRYVTENVATYMMEQKITLYQLLND